ncbi:hypothetical protein [Phenylobacterium montanum]|uniref:Secreted protein n=1 Tax=Phenylobacterium montanum TaxID=2823693 RepID=A0A975G3B3_9CAUL|nr:hypothetical protein [Caulobacter sp. S6]QUD89231.1 hypothetical protein KCG34_04945 [Caulobacter sp. S6]
MPFQISNLAKAGLAAAALLVAATSAPNTASAQSWGYGDRMVTRCDSDGDRCATLRCDHDGDDCARIRDWRPAWSGGWRREGFGYGDGNGYGYGRTETRCDDDGDRCAHFRCDDDGDRCVRVSHWWRND